MQWTRGNAEAFANPHAAFLDISDKPISLPMTAMLIRSQKRLLIEMSLLEEAISLKREEYCVLVRQLYALLALLR